MSKIPKTPQEVFPEFVDDLKGIYGEALQSVILYGSGARGEYVAGKSDINFLVVLAEDPIASAPPPSQTLRDLAALDRSPCPCGRTGVRMGRVVGRSDDMLIIRGVNVFPSQVEAALLAVEGTQPHYQIVLTRDKGLDQVEVQVEQVDRMARQVALDYVTGYLEGGNQRLAVYRDADRARSLRAEVDRLRAELAALNTEWETRAEG